MGLMMKNLNIIKYYGVHWKIWFLKGVVHEKRIYRGNCLKRGLSSLQIGAWQKRGGGVLRGGWYSNASCVLAIHQKF